MHERVLPGPLGDLLDFFEAQVVDFLRRVKRPVAPTRAGARRVLKCPLFAKGKRCAWDWKYDRGHFYVSVLVCSR